MRYINKNKIVEAKILTPKDCRILCMDRDDLYCLSLDITPIYKNPIFVYKNTKAECIALAEKLGLTLID